MLDRTAIGRSTPPTLNEVERGAVRRFAEAVGDYNPVAFDADYAKGAGLAGITPPPGFVCALSSGADLHELLGVPLKNLLLAELACEFERALVAGDRLLVTCRVLDVAERPGPAGKVEVAVIEDEGRDLDGRLVYRARRTYVVRIARES